MRNCLMRTSCGSTSSCERSWGGIPVQQLRVVQVLEWAQTVSRRETYASSSSKKGLGSGGPRWTADHFLSIWYDWLNSSKRQLANVCSWPKADIGLGHSSVRSPLRFQPIDATHCSNRSAGVSKSNVCRGRSLSCRATALSLF